MRKGKNQPAPKRTTANLRKLSELGRAIRVIKNGIAKLNCSVTAIDENDLKDVEKYARYSLEA
ncbi:hypothetical protein SAMN05428987_5246 [Paenibacillus sp. CF095]|nr:hypothetical protein SAMN05428987_5246 [Paenibacillus sp. CF095]